MHFLIQKNILLNGLNLTSRAISNFSPLPAYSGIKFDVTDKGLYLTGSDSDISIETFIPINNDENSYLEIKNSGSIVIDAKYIIDIVRKIDSSNIEIEVVDGCTTKIRGGNSEFNIIGMYATEYPNLDFNNLENNFSMKSEYLKLLINQTIFASSDKDTRPALTGLNFETRNSKLYVTATDSYRMAKSAIDLESDLDFNITIPSKSLSEVLKSLDDYEDIKISLSSKKIQFIFENTIIQTRLIDAKYPETSKLIPEKYQTNVKFSLRDVLGSIDRASFIKNDGISLIKLSVNESECILSSKSQEIGSVVEKIDNFEFDGEPLEISFNGKYVMEALKTIRNENVVFKFSGQMQAFIIVEEDNENLVQLILPVKTY